MTRLLWTLARRVYLWPALVVLVVTLAYQVDLLGFRYALWIRTSEVAHSALQLAGPVMVGAGGYAALRLTRNTGLLGQSSAVRHGRGMVGLHLAAGVLALGGAYALGLAPLFVWTMATATWGHPLVLPLINAAVSSIACLCIGYGVCRLVPSPALPPILAVAAFWILGGAAAADGDGWNMLTPVRFRQYRLGSHNNLEAMGLQVLIYGLLAAAAVTAVVLLGYWAHRSLLVRQGVPTLVLVAPLLLIPVGLATRPPLFERGSSSPAPVCTQAPDVSVPVCTHPALRRDLPQAALAASRVIALYGGQPPTGTQRIVATGDRRLQQPGDLHITVAPSAPLRFYVTISLTQQLAGWAECEAKFPERVDDFGNPLRSEQADLAQAISGWLNHHTGYEYDHDNIIGERAHTLLERLNSLPEATVTDWLRTNRERVAHCDLPISEVP